MWMRPNKPPNWPICKHKPMNAITVPKQTDLPSVPTGLIVLTWICLLSMVRVQELWGMNMLQQNDTNLRVFLMFALLGVASLNRNVQYVSYPQLTYVLD